MSNPVPGVLNPAYAPIITPTRPNGDGMGNKGTSTPLPQTPMVPWITGSTMIQGERGLVSVQTGEVYVPRTYDLKAGDQFPWNGSTFTVFGLAQGDQLHPLTGDDFGWKFFQIQGSR